MSAVAVQGFRTFADINAVVGGSLRDLAIAQSSQQKMFVAEAALAHARLAGIPPDRVVNCWPLDQLQAWLANPASVHRR